jgi:hypothetical protein
MATTWSLGGTGPTGTYLSQSLSTYTQVGSTETSTSSSGQAGVALSVPATTFGVAGQPAWAPLTSAYPVSQTMPPLLRIGGPALATAVPLGPQELAAGRPGLPVIYPPMMLFLTSSPGLPWRLSVAGRPLTALGALTAVPDTAAPPEAGLLATHGGVNQDLPAGGWQPWSWQPQLLTALWMQTQGLGHGSELGAWGGFAPSHRSGNPLKMVSTASWEFIISHQGEGDSLSLDWIRRGVEFGAGVFNTLTGNLIPIAGGYVNTQSSAYQYGVYAGR